MDQERLFCFLLLCFGSALVLNTNAFTFTANRISSLNSFPLTNTKMLRQKRCLKMNTDPQGLLGVDEEDIDFDLWESGYSSVHVAVSTKPGTENAFVTSSIENAKNSVLEPGVARFDVLQSLEDPTKFQLLEVYNNPQGGAAHKETAHYSKWRDDVADMMAEPRSAKKYRPLFPFPDFWMTDKKASETIVADPEPYYAVVVDIQIKPEFDEARFIGHTLYNCEQSMQEEGVARFDLLQNEEDQRNFLLLEVYKTEAAAAAHKETAHYNVWSEEVAILMARPRESQKFKTIFPSRAYFEWTEDFAAMDIDTDLLDLWIEEEKDFITSAESVTKKDQDLS